jgi:carbon storage regulator
MLVLTRKKGEQVVIGAGDLTIHVEVVDIGKGRVKLGISAPESVAVHRHEIWQALNQWQEEPIALR